MSLLYRVVYAAHANGSHHKLALDALQHLSGSEAERWQRLFLSHAGGYLEGSKAPDNTFKDFKNHVLHVGDGYWGGAIGKVEEWYATLVEHLASARWAEAVHAAGVLSHYYVDPIHPFHTAQSDAENAIHRAAEWSINRSYDALLKLARAGRTPLSLTIEDGDGWLRALVCAGAETSNSQYERLIAHYDIHKGVVDPPLGLDQIAQGLVADLIDYAGRGYALILDRAFTQSGATPPDVSLTLATVMAGLKVPKKWLMKRIADAEDRRVVEAMYDELKTTGRVEAALPEDDRAVRDLYAEEVLKPRLAARDKQRAAVVAAAARPSVAKPSPKAAEPVPVQNSPVQPQAKVRPEPPAIVVPELPRPAAADAAPLPELSAGLQHRAAALSARLAATTPTSVPAVERPVTAPPAPAAPIAIAQPMLSKPVVAAAPPAPAAPQTAAPATVASSPAPTPSATPAMVVPAVPATPKPVAVPAVSPRAVPAPAQPSTLAPQSESAIRIFLAAGDPLENAPSIGPKGAARFAPLGIKTVGDFLAGEPKDLANRFAIRQVTPEVIAAWQAQARLVMRVPGLRGTHAQLLVGAGFPTPEAIAKVDSDALCAAVLAFATSAEGKRLLRDGPPPDIERIKSWCDSARRALAA